MESTPMLNVTVWTVSICVHLHVCTHTTAALNLVYCWCELSLLSVSPVAIPSNKVVTFTRVNQIQNIGHDPRVTQEVYLMRARAELETEMHLQAKFPVSLEGVIWVSFECHVSSMWVSGECHLNHWLNKISWMSLECHLKAAKYH